MLLTDRIKDYTDDQDTDTAKVVTDLCKPGLGSSSHYRTDNRDSRDLSRSAKLRESFRLVGISDRAIQTIAIYNSRSVGHCQSTTYI